MKKLNKKGFTLIELLAVIVIMGILMVVAIPAVTRTIENSRKDTFVNTAKQYVNQVQTLWASDGLKCGADVSTAVGTGTYYVEIDSTNNWLLDQGGKSSWGNKDVKGYVEIAVTATSTGDLKKDYSVGLSDGVHGFAVTPVDNLARGSVVSTTSVSSTTGSIECVEN